MDPLLRQEALVKKSQGDNYVGKRQAMVAARLQARGLKGRAYYDSADHSMQQQKKQQQIAAAAAAQEEEEAKEGPNEEANEGQSEESEAATSAPGGKSSALAKSNPLAANKSSAAPTARSTPLGTEKTFNKFASESGSLNPAKRAGANKPESGSLGAAPQNRGTGSEPRVVSLGSLGAGKAGAKSTLAPGAKPTVLAAPVAAEQESATPAATEQEPAAAAAIAASAGEDSEGASVGLDAESSASGLARKPSLSSSPAPAIGAVKPAPAVGLRVSGVRAGGIGASESGDQSQLGSSVRSAAAAEPVKSGVPAVAVGGVRSTGIKIRSLGDSGANASVGPRTSNISASGAGLSKMPSGDSNAAAGGLDGRAANITPAAVGGVRTVKLGTGGVRSVNLGVRTQQQINSMPKAYDLGRSLHRGPSSGTSPLGARGPSSGTHGVSPLASKQGSSSLLSQSSVSSLNKGDGDS
mmetsp:Transcript_14998/g.40223  ORF Transcript_14998/g.40223 Transcript_14998/m.40223 type:complete len:467 (-) Transcript_14998:481-1881(-)|eukprot:CAMPEP_0185836664 /NCGR_PEP_ID=MMETSP1353-20130828/10103_1 /TAXON_ID=1077150 /ORGANISM="Erythrolobus australicus, Strain CCMP3124" /LENGTH=466 /DNA_ID=CAMNT_0028535481 /DNA_START=485 /DNA_END=1885 /DNA_ORIENTATION=-